jgi:hypothetical protein
MELNLRLALRQKLIGMFATLKFSALRLAHFITYPSTNVPVTLPDKLVVGEPVTATLGPRAWGRYWLENGTLPSR